MIEIKIEEIEAALEQFREIVTNLSNGKSKKHGENPYLPGTTTFHGSYHLK